MLAETPDRVLIVLIVVVHIAVVGVQVPGVVLWIVRVLSRRPVIVTWETSYNNSFRLNHDNLLCSCERGRWHSFSHACLSDRQTILGNFISFVRTFSNSLFDLQYQGFSRLEKNMRFLYQAD